MPEQDPQLAGSPADISHIYKGYAPLSIRLVEAALSGGWGPVSEVLADLPGAQFDVLQVRASECGRWTAKYIREGW
jgi:hypothetical protein